MASGKTTWPFRGFEQPHQRTPMRIMLHRQRQPGLACFSALCSAQQQDGHAVSAISRINSVPRCWNSRAEGHTENKRETIGTLQNHWYVGTEPSGAACLLAFRSTARINEEKLRATLERDGMVSPRRRFDVATSMKDKPL